ncbi:dicarboxylate/amino acid:cation symporter [Lactiplantibacillus sp. DA1]|uniref:dicarboxylate/amino acid:cation symporter n=1 Tax=Lactiplantibacillus sp. DA1 TaxID=3079857 RepID=UPI00292A61D0|nr:dicarboxylate/amino acid:cation symporter [Lactiplantibacillus sp. DA1]MDV0429770.1 dicarboxylate/amino acid:cation symporter [Lactiplantibacillus sp. DA1]
MMLTKITLTTQILIAMMIGSLLGIIGGQHIVGIKLIGEVFLRLIQMAVTPLILFSVIEAIGNLPGHELGRLGIKTAGWFAVTTLVAALIGLVVGWWFKPGHDLHLPLSQATQYHLLNHHPSINQTILAFFPTNIFDALQTGNTIQIIIFASLLGIVLSQENRHHQYDSFLVMIHRLNHLFIRLITLIMHLAPFGIGALMAWVTATNGVTIILPLAKFLILLAGSSFIFLTGLFALVMCNAHLPLRGLLHGFTRIVMVAMTTTSSAATLPIEMTDAEERLGIQESISQLVLPLGMALNSNGLAMYLSLACVTLSQFYGLNLPIITMLRIVTLSIVACLGTVVVPGGGLVALTIIVPTLGLPLETIGLLAGIDWIAGIFRTLLNVVGDTTTAILIAANEHQLNRDVYQSK